MADLKQALRNADAAGDEVAARRIAAMIKEQDSYAPKDMAESALAPAEVLTTMGTSGLAEILGGYAGIAGSLLPGEEGQGVDWLNQVRDALTYQPRTRAAQEALVGMAPIGEFFQDIEQGSAEIGGDVTGSPVGAAVGATIPTLITELPLFKLPKVAARAAKIKSAKAIDEAIELDEQALKPQAPEDIAKTLQGSEQDIKVAADVDPSYYQAAEELGLQKEPLPSYASQSQQYRGVEQGLAAVPESMLNTQGKEFVADVANRADGLIEEFGGDIDKARVSDEFRIDSLKTVDELGAQADELYNQLDKGIAKNTSVETPNSIELINTVADEFGGADKMPPVFKSMLNRLSGEELPTFAQLDFLRKEVGQAIGKKSGEFKNAESGSLKRAYRALTEDQDLIANEFGLGDVSAAAKDLVRKRKALEDNLVSVLGRDLSGDLMPKVSGAIKQLTGGKGSVAKWDSLMAKLPKESRQRVVATALNDIFKGSGSGQKGFSTNQFTKFYEELNRSPKAKARLFKELPFNAKRDLDNLFKISKGIDTALKDKIPTGMVTRFFDQNTGFLKKMLGKGVAAGAGLKGGPLASSVVDELFKGSSNTAKATSDMLASPKFQQMIREAVSDGVQDGAKAGKKSKAIEQALKKSKQFNEWSKSLDDVSRQQLAAQGMIGYLFSEEEEK